MAKRVCDLLVNMESVEQNTINLGSMPVGDLFKVGSLTTETYELFSNIISY
jgi:hypothetical protein